MKKIFLKTIAIILLLVMICPGFVNAATISINKLDGMKVDETVKVTISTQNPVSNMQFDIEFDSTKYEYIPNSAKSALESTYSSLCKKDTVRVSAVDYNGKSSKTVTLEFKAIATGDSVPFTVGGTVELGENGEKLDKSTIKVSKIEPAPKKNNDIENLKEDSKYISEDGKEIKSLPQTGNTNIENIKSLGIYTRLILEENQGYKLIVPYALSNSDQTVSVNDIKNEFGEITTSATNLVKTGDTFNKNGNKYTVIVYGDFNADGRITTLDALEIGKYTLDDATNAYTKEQIKAADVKNDGKITKQDGEAIQKFIVGNGTIIDNKPAKVVGITQNGTSAVNGNLSKTLYTKNTNQAKQYNGLLYTIIPIQLIDEKGKTSKILNKDINTDANKNNIGTVSILEKDYESITTADISVIGWVSNGQGGYEPNSGAYQSIDAIGIAIKTNAPNIPNMGGSSKNRLEKGLVIKYDGIDANGNVCRKNTTIDITVDDTDPQIETTIEKTDKTYTVKNSQTKNSVQEQSKDNKSNTDKAKQNEEEKNNTTNNNTTNNTTTTNILKNTNLAEPKVVENKTSEK